MRGGALFLYLSAGVWEGVGELDSYVWEGLCGWYMFCCVVRGECLTDGGGGGFGDVDYGFGGGESIFCDVGDGFYGVVNEVDGVGNEVDGVENGVDGVGNRVGRVVDRIFGLKLRIF